MSESFEALKRKMGGGQKLQSVVRTMKILAATNMRQYEFAHNALKDYSDVIDLSLLATFHNKKINSITSSSPKKTLNLFLILGSDQGLVGQFNEILRDFVLKHLSLNENSKRVIVMGELIARALEESGVVIDKQFSVPSSLALLPSFISDLFHELDISFDTENNIVLTLIYNKPEGNTCFVPYEKVILPFSDEWKNKYLNQSWPRTCIPQITEGDPQFLNKLLDEYLFCLFFSITLESLISENSSRFLTMQRAEKNIDELLVELQQLLHRLRQNSIDAELFDVISGFEALLKTN